MTKGLNSGLREAVCPAGVLGTPLLPHNANPTEVGPKKGVALRWSFLTISKLKTASYSILPV